MKKRPVIIAAACMLWAAPALAGQADVGPSPSGSEHSRDLGSMRGSFGEPRTYGYDPETEMRRHGEGEGRYRHGEGEWRHYHGEGMREGCKYITVRQRQGDEIIVRHFRRCD
jgi:hypothetical protein